MDHEKTRSLSSLEHSCINKGTLYKNAVRVKSVLNKHSRGHGLFNVFLVSFCLLVNSCVSPISRLSLPHTIDGEEDAGHVRSDLVFLTATELAGKIRSREVTSLEVVNAHLAHIKKYNPVLNAIITLDENGALERAAKADESLSKGVVWGRLHGVPITVKDNYAVAGMLTTNGYPPQSEFIPEKDAVVVKRLNDAGAIILGRTNMPMLATDCQTYNPIFGVTNNPWDVTRTPGGSSGGSAAAVAAGLIPLDLANDYGGSIRIPCHFCGVYGLKPTDSLISNEGLFPGVPWGESKAIRHFLSCGPIARSVDDLELALDIIAGPDSKNADACRSAEWATSCRPLKDLRIAWTDEIQGIPITAEYKGAIMSFVSELKKSGCRIERAVPSNFDFISAWQTYGELSDMELNADVPSYKRLFMFAGWLLELKDVPFMKMAFPMTHDKYTEALNRREHFIQGMESFLADWDVWLCPVSSTPSFKHVKPRFHFDSWPVYKTPILVDQVPIKLWTANASYTTLISFTGNPVVTVPIGFTNDGLPLGIQVVGRRFHDWELLSICRKMEKAVAAYKRPPGWE